jgi:hypothetical protein
MQSSISDVKAVTFLSLNLQAVDEHECAKLNNSVAKIIFQAKKIVLKVER